MQSTISETEFRGRVIRALETAGLPVCTEAGVGRFCATNWPMRCGIPAAAGPIVACGAVIACETSCDEKSLCAALGQVLLCQRLFGAGAAVLCFPSNLRLPALFVDACRESGVNVATEKSIAETLGPSGDLGAENCLGEVVGWLRTQDPHQWPDQQVDAWLEDLLPIVEFRQRLLATQNR